MKKGFFSRRKILAPNSWISSLCAPKRWVSKPVSTNLQKIPAFLESNYAHLATFLTTRFSRVLLRPITSSSAKTHTSNQRFRRFFLPVYSSASLFSAQLRTKSAERRLPSLLQFVFLSCRFRWFFCRKVLVFGVTRLSGKDFKFLL